MGRLAYKPTGTGKFAVIEVPGRQDTYFAGHASELGLVADGKGGILTQADDGLLEWDGRFLRTYPHHLGGVPDSSILALNFDREGSLWLGSTGGGAYRSLGAHRWEHWTVEDGLPSDCVWAMARHIKRYESVGSPRRR